MPSQKYRKKPVVIDAMPWDGTVESATEIIDWLLANDATARFHEAQSFIEPRPGSRGIGRPSRPARIAIDTLEGTISAVAGDFIIRGVQGEFYPCKPQIFAATYDVEPS